MAHIDDDEANIPATVEHQSAPTASHALAAEKATRPGGGDDDDGVVNEDGAEVSAQTWVDSCGALQPQIAGMPHEDVQMLIRRFNLLVFRVRAVQDRPLTNLDMGMTEQEQTSPEKLQAHIARLYMTAVIGLFSFWKHIVRLRSWKERQRTSIFLSVYVVAWLADLLTPTFFLFLMILITAPRSRSRCFPPAPPSMINATTGGIQKPPAGMLASEQTVTGAPENCKGEAVELEAYSFIACISKVIHAPQTPRWERAFNNTHTSCSRRLHQTRITAAARPKMTPRTECPK